MLVVPAPRQLPFMECMSAYPACRASKETEVKPSAKINLDYVPTPQLPRWPSHQQRTVLEISDDEEDEEDDD